jgi:outer membrane lipoprotein-sorting protein
MRFNYLIAVPFLFVLSVASAAAQEASIPPAHEIAARMVARDAQRQVSLDGYAGMRRYILINDHMHKRAEMVVRVSGDPDGTKHFEVVSETGWKAAQKHVLHKMLESESETSRPEAREKTRVCAENYDFQVAGTETANGRTVYAIDVTPKRREKYLFQGRIWVDAEDYALVRAEGNPSKNPSFWTKSVHFVHTYEKNGAFWFPVTTESVTDARIFGVTNLTIEYFGYKANALSEPRNSTEIAQRGTRP